MHAALASWIAGLHLRTEYVRISFFFTARPAEPQTKSSMAKITHSWEIFYA